MLQHKSQDVSGRNLVILDKRDGMCNVHAIRKYGVELRVSFVGYTSTFMPEQCGFHAFF